MAGEQRPGSLSLRIRGCCAGPTSFLLEVNTVLFVVPETEVIKTELLEKEGVFVFGQSTEFRAKCLQRQLITRRWGDGPRIGADSLKT